MTDKQIASDRIAVLLGEIKTKIAAAQEIADNANVGIQWNYETLGLGYGMGGWYRPAVEGEPEFNRYGDSNFGWRASSSSC